MPAPIWRRSPFSRGAPTSRRDGRGSRDRGRMTPMDPIDEIVARAMNYARDVLRDEPKRRSLALEGLARMCDSLAQLVDKI